MMMTRSELGRALSGRGPSRRRSYVLVNYRRCMQVWESHQPHLQPPVYLAFPRLQVSNRTYIHSPLSVLDQSRKSRKILAAPISPLRPAWPTQKPLVVRCMFEVSTTHWVRIIEPTEVHNRTPHSNQVT